MTREHKAQALARKYLAQGRGLEATNRMLRAVGSNYRVDPEYPYRLIHRLTDVG